MVNTERRAGHRHREPEVYANGNVMVVYPHELDREVHVIFDEHSQLVVRNFTHLEFGFEGEINRVELKKSHHTRTICEFQRVGVSDGKYVYEVHSPRGPVGTMTTISLRGVDLAFASLFVEADSRLDNKTKEPRLVVDENVRAFIANTAGVARAHRRPHNC
ncbi:MAG: hypothetical protein HY344_01985 [Candidatus Levybacteria bacterium]|nr:hypothetical protein [Candidatus Levybacteria bacterium]